MSQQIIITKEQLKRIGGLLKEQSNGIRAYSFDWDDNILKMPTKIKMLKKSDTGWEPVDVGTHEFALVRDHSDYKLDDGVGLNGTGVRGSLIYCPIILNCDADIDHLF